MNEQAHIQASTPLPEATRTELAQASMTPQASPQQHPQQQSVSPLQYIKGIGPRRAEALAAEGILTPRDLLRFYPRTYIDRNAIPSLRELRTALLDAQQQDAFSQEMLAGLAFQGEVTVVAFVRAVRERTFGKGRTMVIVELDDYSGTKAEMVFWNQAMYFKRLFEPDQLLAVSGVPEYEYGKIQFHHPEIDRIDVEDAELYRDGSILPKYRLSQKMKDVGLTMRVMRNVVAAVIDAELLTLEETLSDELLERLDFPRLQDAVRELHFPASRATLERARERMKFEELFFFELLLAMRHRGTKTLDKAPVCHPKSPRARTLLDALPFKLTGAQVRVIKDITADMSTERPMNRLLQGDVGSGKTIVALLTMLMAIDSGYQCALMAPTEILAEQHYNTLRGYLAETDVNVVQLVGGQKTKARREVLETIASGKAHIIVGTHALFQSTVEYHSLAFVVIDEQHRFGVVQRAELKAKATASFQHISPPPRMGAQTFLSASSSAEIEKKRPNLPRWTLSEATYFITFSTDQHHILSKQEQKIVFDHILEGAQEFYRLLATVIMPDHVHILLQPLDDYTLSEILKGIKGVSANKMNKTRSQPDTIWQSESFDWIIRSQKDLEEKLLYMSNNPIKAGLVEQIEDYPFQHFALSQARMSALPESSKLSTFLKSSTSSESSVQPTELAPHILVMSATPIPRTLSMTLYGDLDVSVIDELPKNRKPIKTRVVFESKLPDVFDFIRKQAAKGFQTYIVYPLVEKSEKVEAKSAVEHYEHLQHEVFPDLKLGLLHGQMFWYEKEDAMKAFKNKEFDILVATTVVEVGIDVPNATVMLIENAERFGLAQLHQLRGRVGRGAEQSYCLLATKDHFKFHLGKREHKSADKQASDRKACIVRLKTMQNSTDGFAIAEVDLQLRGPGDFMGTRQSGIPEFTFTDLTSDGEAITQARREAFALVADDPHLRKPHNTLIRQEFLRQNKKNMQFFDVA
jgi:ATP-dependent DNA helicase RecG